MSFLSLVHVNRIFVFWLQWYAEMWCCTCAQGKNSRPEIKVRRRMLPHLLGFAVKRYCSTEASVQGPAKTPQAKKLNELQRGRKVAHPTMLLTLCLQRDLICCAGSQCNIITFKHASLKSCAIKNGFNLQPYVPVSTWLTVLAFAATRKWVTCLYQVIQSSFHSTY